MDVKINESWKTALKEEFEKEYFKKLTKFVREEYTSKKVYPSPENLFRAFDLCPFDKVKVVILGQDPYHGPRQAHGLSFSVRKGIMNPPSLVNIFNELESDLGIKIENGGDLSSWAKEGVLLLNSTLTVLASKAGSHQGKGWEEFTDSVIKILSEKKENLVFILWGAYAQKKGAVINNKHLVIKSPHPSPLSSYRGFFGSKPFSKTNNYLKEKGIKEINWKI